jgi:hypothetical protein
MVGQSRFRPVLSATLLGISLVSGCTMPPGTIFREKPLVGGGQLDMTDSRVRVVSTQRPDISTKPGIVVPTSITCVEPQPQVALALANGFGAGISIFQKGSGALANSVSENVFQTEERTIAIQALLNAGYQNCLDYSNGAITNTFYAIRASNLDNLLVTLSLASESAGNLRSNLGSASTEATAEAQASQSFLASAVDDIQKSAKVLGDARRNTTAAREKLVEKKSDLVEAEKNKTKADNDLSEVKKFNEGNDPAVSKVEDKPTTDEDKAVADTTEKEKAAKTAVEDAQKELDAAEQEQNDLENAMLSKVAASADTSAGGKDVKGAGGPSGRPTDTAVLTMGEMQRRFIDRSSSGQYITACLVELGLGTANKVGGALPLDPPVDPPKSGQLVPSSNGATALPKPGQAANGANPSDIGTTFERSLWEDAEPYLKQRLTDGEFNQDDADIFMMMARSERDSQLAQFCKGHLNNLVDKAQAYEQELALQRGVTEHVRAVGNVVDILVKMSEQCSAISGTDEAALKLRDQCRKQVELLTAFATRDPAPAVTSVPLQ